MEERPSSAVTEEQNGIDGESDSSQSLKRKLPTEDAAGAPAAKLPATCAPGNAAVDSTLEGGKTGKFRIQVQNLPKYLGMKQFRKFVERTGVKIKGPKVQNRHGFFSVESLKEQKEAIEFLKGSVLKGCTLDARPAADDMYQYQRNRGNQGEVGEAKDEEESVSQTPEQLHTMMLDAVIPLREVPYDKQLEDKSKEIRSVYRDICREIKVVSAAQLNTDGIYGTLESIVGIGKDVKRNKCEFTIGWSQEKKPVVGFKPWGFRKKGFSPVVSAAECSHLTDFMKTSINKMEGVLAISDNPPFNPSEGSGVWRTLTVKDFKKGRMVIVAFHPQQIETDELTKMAQELKNAFLEENQDDNSQDPPISLYWQKQEHSSQAGRPEHLGGPGYAEEEMYGKLQFRVSPAAFFQTSTVAAEALYRKVGELCPDGGCDYLLLDICCGTGTIGISLAEKFGFVLGLELCKEAVEDAKKNAQLNRVSNIRFVAGKAEEVFQNVKFYLPKEFPNVVGILDPPRCGLPDKIIAGIRKMASMKTLIYVSCAPKAAKKNFLDLCRLPSNKFPGSPFKIERIAPVDMFPNTSHYEWVLVFTRKYCPDPFMAETGY